MEIACPIHSVFFLLVYPLSLILLLMLYAGLPEETRTRGQYQIGVAKREKLYC